MSEVQTILIPHFRTHTGAVLDSISLHYQLFGLELDQAPVVLVNHSLTGDADVSGAKGWWKEIIGPNLTIDTLRYAVLAFNIPGNGVQGQVFSNPEDFHTGDIATLFLKGLEVLKVKELYALIGG
ncbi:MAG: hypothetical protein VW080_03550, partial [Flavobacteriaceae bacterium]